MLEKPMPPSWAALACAQGAGLQRGKATWQDFIRQLGEISSGNLAGFNPHSFSTSRWHQGTAARRHGASRDRCRKYGQPSLPARISLMALASWSVQDVPLPPQSPASVPYVVTAHLAISLRIILTNSAWFAAGCRIQSLNHSMCHPFLQLFPFPPTS